MITCNAMQICSVYHVVHPNYMYVIINTNALLFFYNVESVPRQLIQFVELNAFRRGQDFDKLQSSKLQRVPCHNN